MAPTSGGGIRRIPDVQCMRRAGHLRDGGDAEHEFYAADVHSFGVSREKGRWVTRR